MPLKPVTPADRLLTVVRRLQKELDLAIREYLTETAEPRPRRDKKVYLPHYDTGKPVLAKGARK